MAHKPDRFDMYSAGIVLMQLALPSLRTNSGLQGWPRLEEARAACESGEGKQGPVESIEDCGSRRRRRSGLGVGDRTSSKRPYEAEDEEEDPQERPSAMAAKLGFQVDPTELAVEVKKVSAIIGSPIRPVC